MARRIVVLRHGLTAWNAEGRYQGQADVELTETGHQQAKAAAIALVKAYDITRIVSSDLLRTRQTAACLAEESGLPVAYDERLREIHVGDVSGLTRPEIIARFGEVPTSWEGVGGESWEMVRHRYRPALEEVATTLGEGETAVVVSHGGAIRNGVAAFLGWPESLIGTLAPLANCSWVELIDGGRQGFTGGSAPWRLAAYGRVAG